MFMLTMMTRNFTFHFDQIISQSDSSRRCHGALYSCDQNLDVELSDDKMELILLGTRQKSAKVNEYSIRVGHLNNCPEKFGACGSTLNHKRVRILLSLAHHRFCIKRRIGKFLFKRPIYFIETWLLSRSFLWPTWPLNSEHPDVGARLSYQAQKFCLSSPILFELHLLPLRQRVI